MHIGNRLFPYPVLNNNKLYSHFKNGEFSLSYSENINEEEFILEDLVCRLKSDYMLNLIIEKKVEILCIVECPLTMFRKSYKIIPNEKNRIIIPISDLNGKYYISAYMVAKENFLYKSEEFLDDYNEYTFKIEKNYILAVDDGFVNKISFDSEVDIKKSSIFIVIKDKKNINETMQIDYDQDKIIISLPEKQWNIYDKMKRISQFQDIYFSIIAVPALGYSLSKLQNSNNYDSIDLLKIEYKWFSTFAEAYKKIYDKEIDDEIFFKNMNVYTEAQVVLNNPVTRSIDCLFSLTIGQAVTEYED